LIYKIIKNIKYTEEFILAHENFIEIKPGELKESPFDLIGSEWMLIGAAKSETDFNMMTASWGSMGIMWAKHVLTCVIRNTPYTFEFTENSDHAAFSFFGDGCREQLSRLGSKSGREINKIKDSGLTPVVENGTVWFEEARLVIIGKKLYAHDISPEEFKVPDLCEKIYPGKDYHRVYTYEIEKVLVKK